MLGRRVRALRTAAGLSQEQLAEVMRERGFSWRQTTTAKTEAGDRPVRVNEAAALAAILRTSVAGLLGEQEVDTQPASLMQREAALRLARRRVHVLERELAEAQEHARQAEDHFDATLRGFAASSGQAAARIYGDMAPDGWPGIGEPVRHVEFEPLDPERAPRPTEAAREPGADDVQPGAVRRG